MWTCNMLVCKWRNRPRLYYVLSWSKHCHAGIPIVSTPNYISHMKTITCPCYSLCRNLYFFWVHTFIKSPTRVQVTSVENVNLTYMRLNGDMKKEIIIFKIEKLWHCKACESPVSAGRLLNNTTKLDSSLEGNIWDYLVLLISLKSLSRADRFILPSKPRDQFLDMPKIIQRGLNNYQMNHESITLNALRKVIFSNKCKTDLADTKGSQRVRRWSREPLYRRYAENTIKHSPRVMIQGALIYQGVEVIFILEGSEWWYEKSYQFGVL